MRFGSGSRSTSTQLLGAIAIVSAIVLAACGSSDSGAATTSTTEATTTVPKQDHALDGKAFTSTSVTGYDLVKGTKLEMAFEEQRLSVNAGCNSLGSTYSFTGTELKWTSPPAATMMACPDDLMAQDTWITGLLTAGMKAKLDGDTLTLSSGDVTIVLASSADAPVVGTEWTLTGTISGGAVTPVPAGVRPPTLSIAADGAAKVYTGCNSGSSTVKVATDTLTFGPLATTRMYCAGAAGELENQVLNVLDGEVQYVDDGTTLTLGKDDLGLVYTARS